MNETGPRGHSHVIRAVCVRARARVRVFTRMHASLRSDLELMPGSPVGTSRCGERGPCNAFGREVQHYVQSERRPDCILKITSPWQVVGVQKKFSEWRNKECPNEHTAHTSYDFTAEQWAAAGPSPSRAKVSKGSGPGRARTQEKRGNPAGRPSSVRSPSPRTGLTPFPLRPTVFELNSYRKWRVSPSPRGRRSICESFRSARGNRGWGGERVSKSNNKSHSHISPASRHLPSDCLTLGSGVLA